MSNRTSATLIKVLIAGMLAAILVVSAFGLGVTVGSRFPLQTALADAAQNAAPELPAAGGTPGAVAGTGSAPGGGLIDMTLFNEAWNLLQRQFYGNLPQGKDITYAAIRGVVSSLGDQHTAFLDPQSAAMMNSDIDGHFEGIGARVASAPGGGVLITYVFPDQPAQQAGLQADDIILAVDGQDVTMLSLTDAISKIRGPNGSKVKLSVVRQGEPPSDVVVTRARIEIPVVQTKTLGNSKIAYVSLAEFSSVAPNRLSDALKQALAQKPAGLILDLRGNPGGLLDGAVRVGSYFVPKGNILLERTKDGTRREYAREGSYLLGNTPLVVLVDGGSASASEIVAGAIQDAGTGVLMGEKTYGKGSVQLPNTMSDGSQLRVTIAHWFTPKDRAIDKVGLVPDFIVPLTKADVDAKRDPQLDAAVKYLLGDRQGLQTATPQFTRPLVGTVQPALPAGTPTPVVR